jgi:hypothetical protein
MKMTANQRFHPVINTLMNVHIFGKPKLMHFI